ncbi:hypothetical protein [Nocardioides sp. ChNu-99]|uniref:hypothetical protein n=1 Tax=Nocardioides sp. ChNu-99 TaxID=2839897 RepID=UPI0024074B86|nr:hypothetical protein [Nocardioides sp. ChNu-99]MDF9716155.1 hypothetical protein [Nocardioides sp. ChNu-99]
MTALPVPAPDGVDLGVVAQLRDRVTAMQGGPTRLPLPTHPALAELLQLRAGGAYGVDSARLALALVAGASAAGEWVAVVGWPDLGVEAALDLGLDPARTVLVPDPGDLWLEATAALVDVVRLVVLRPRGVVDPKSASVLEARLRKRSAALVVWGDWPRCEARLSVERVRWTGAERGEGRLRERWVRVAVRRGAAPPRHADLRFPAEQGGAARLEGVGRAVGRVG